MRVVATRLLALLVFCVLIARRLLAFTFAERAVARRLFALLALAERVLFLRRPVALLALDAFCCCGKVCLAGACWARCLQCDFCRACASLSVVARWLSPCLGFCFFCKLSSCLARAGLRIVVKRLLALLVLAERGCLQGCWCLVCIDPFRALFAKQLLSLLAIAELVFVFKAAFCLACAC